MTTPARNPDPYAPENTALSISKERAMTLYALKSQAAVILQDEQAKAQIMPYLPKGVSYEEVIVEVHRAATVNPDILRCTPASIIMAVGMAVQVNLVIGKTIHLVPVKTKVSRGNETPRYEDRLQAWTDYKGDIELVVRAGAARVVDAKAIYAGDTFEHEEGTAPFIRHLPTLDPTKRGKLIGAYAIAWINNTGTLRKQVVLPLEDVEKVRKGSKQWSPEKVKECPDWYAMKTAVHRVCKTLPKAPGLAKILALFEQQDQADRLEEGEEALDPTLRIEAGAAPDPAAATAVANLPHNSAPADDDAKWGGEVPAAASTTPALSKAGQVLMPFSETYRGRPIADVPVKELGDALAWAKRQTNLTRQYPEFIAAAEEYLEELRFAEPAS